MKAAIREQINQLLAEADRAQIPPELREKLAKGGRHPSTAKQKITVRQKIGETKPWLSVKPETRARSNFKPYQVVRLSAKSSTELSEQVQQTQSAIALFKQQVLDRGLAKTVKWRFRSEESFSLAGQSAIAVFRVWVGGKKDIAAIDALWLECQK